MKAIESIKDTYSYTNLLPFDDIQKYTEQLLTEFVNTLLEDRFDLFKMSDGFERHFCDDCELLFVENVKEVLTNFLKEIYNDNGTTVN